MQQRSSQSLVQYWDQIRAGRVAPQRCDIEPARIAGLLPVTFILDCTAHAGFSFRLAGTRICEQLGRELRGVDMRDMFDAKDRKNLENLLQAIVAEGGVGIIEFEATCAEGREVQFEVVVMPVIHASSSVNRLLGCLTAIDPPYWLGSTATVRHSVTSLRKVPVETVSRLAKVLALDEHGPVIMASDGARRFRVIEGGRSQ
jgi:hypothetical protein